MHCRISKTPFVSTTTELIRNIFKCGGPAKGTEADIGISKFQFSLESSNLVSETNTVHCFPCSGRFIAFTAYKRPTRYPYQSSFPVNTVTHESSSWFSTALGESQPFRSRGPGGALCADFPLCLPFPPQILTGRVLKDEDWIELILLRVSACHGEHKGPSPPGTTAWTHAWTPAVLPLVAFAP